MWWKLIPCSLVKKDSEIVSFLNVDLHVPDAELIGKPNSINVGEIKRIYYPETGIKIENTVCLPKLYNLFRRTNSYRVIHDNRTKLCYLCNKIVHVIRDCSDYVCFWCNQLGHFRRPYQVKWPQQCCSYVCNCYTEVAYLETNIQKLESGIGNWKWYCWLLWELFYERGLLLLKAHITDHMHDLRLSRKINCQVYVAREWYRRRHRHLTRYTSGWRKIRWLHGNERTGRNKEQQYIYLRYEIGSKW